MPTKEQAKQPIIPKEIVHMAKFCYAAMQVSQQCPELEGHARKAIDAVKRAQIQMIDGKPTRWRASRHVKRLVSDIYERFGTVPY